VTGFTFQQQVSVLSAAAEKTRQRARWCSGYRREPHTHRHTHTRESVRFTGEREKKTQQSLTRSPSRRSTLIRVSLSLSNFLNISCLFFSYSNATPNNFHHCVVLLSCKIIYKSS
jgi:hypothetical protein